MKLAKRLLALALSAGIIVLSPGLPAYQALAAEFEGGLSRPSASFALPQFSVQNFSLVSWNSLDIPAREAAINVLAQTPEPRAMEILETIGTAPGGLARDYEIKRKALRELAKKGKIVSLPPVSPEHAQEILAKFKTLAISAAAWDYDGTLEDDPSPAQEETGQALKAMSDAGVETMILSARSDKGDSPSILNVLSSLTPKQRASISLGASAGARVLLFDKKGNPRLIREMPGWSKAETQRLEAAVLRLDPQYQGQVRVFHDHALGIFFPQGTSRAHLENVAAALQKEWPGQKIRVPGFETIAYIGQPYLSIHKYEKAVGVEFLRQQTQSFGRMRDVYRFIPRPFQKLASRILGRSLGTKVAPEKMLFVGDHFFGRSLVDADMIKGAPGALSIAVGGTADPRLDNVFVWNKKGHAASMEIAKAVADAKTGDFHSIDKKMLWGLFSSRSIGVISFVATSIAFPFLVKQYIGEAGYGQLQTAGQIAAIATAALAGFMVQKFSAKKAWTIYTVGRVLACLYIPAIVAFGAVNFWTLLVAALLNTWVGTFIITVENSYIPKLFGPKNVRTIFSLTQVNTLSLNIIMGLLLGIGSVIGAHSLLIPFVFAAVVNLVIGLPIILKTTPNVFLDHHDEVEPAQAKVSFKETLKKRWPDLVALGTGVAVFLATHSPLAIGAAILFYIARSDFFKKLWAQKPLRWASVFIALAAFLSAPLQFYGLHIMALVAVGKAAQGLLFGKLVGSFLLGQMLGNSLLANLPKIKIPFLGRIPGKHLIEGGALGILSLAVGLSMFPGNWLVALIATGAAILAMMGASHLTDRGRIKLGSLGFLGIFLPLLASASLPLVPLLMLSNILMGFAYGPIYVTLTSYFQNKAQGPNLGKNNGAQSAVSNSAVAMGYSLLAWAASICGETPFPKIIGYMGPVYALAVAAFFFIAPRLLPGLSPRSWTSKHDAAAAVTAPVASPAATQEKLGTNDMADVFRKASTLAASGKKVLMVFDIDDTLLASEQVLGSEPWLDEEFTRILPLNQPETMSLFQRRRSQLLDFQYDSILRLGKAHLVEANVPSDMEAAGRQGVSMMALTSRSDNVREATRRQFVENGMSVDQSNFGLAMTGGENKGKFLASLLKNEGRIYDGVVFVDDKQSNIEEVSSAFAAGNINLIAYRYGRQDLRRQVYSSAEYQAAARVQLKVWKETSRILGDKEALALAKKSPVSESEKNKLIYGTETPLVP